jgi:hypothetical protein
MNLFETWDASVSYFHCRNMIPITIRHTRDEMTGPSSDDWILLSLRLQPLLTTLSDNTIAISHPLNHSSH